MNILLRKLTLSNKARVRVLKAWISSSLEETNVKSDSLHDFRPFFFVDKVATVVLKVFEASCLCLRLINFKTN